MYNVGIYLIFQDKWFRIESLVIWIPSCLLYWNVDFGLIRNQMTKLYRINLFLIKFDQFSIKFDQVLFKFNHFSIKMLIKRSKMVEFNQKSQNILKKLKNFVIFWSFLIFFDQYQNFQSNPDRFLIKIIATSKNPASNFNWKFD